jgi:hypothetical protein
MKKLMLLATLMIAIVIAGCSNGETEKPQENNVIKNDSKTGSQSESEQSEQNTSDFSPNEFFEAFKGNLEHVHGLGYAGNQNAVFFASHDGLKVFADGKWYGTKKLNNDYMGFNAVDQGFYTSGHPGPGVNLPNPLGLKRSFDNGQTLENLGFEGESDFHAMGVSYKNHTIYVLNGHKNSKMDTGLYVSKDDGKSWNKLKANKLGAKILSIAVHPTNDDLVAVAGQQDGIFLSTDGGDNFKLITENMAGTSTFFSNDALWFGAFGNEPKLIKYSVEDASSEEISLPEMKSDAVMYFAQNPQNESELVFISFKGSVYHSTDGGETWTELVNEGKIK